MRAWTAVLAAVLLLLPLPSVPAGGAGRADDLGVYHTYAEMVSELTNLATAHPDILTLESIGKTFEGRDLWAVKLSDNVAQDEAEPNITIFGGIHAGELIGVEVALHILSSLVENYTTNATVGWYVNSTQIWVVPMLNPDGHVYVEQGNQWRKNRSPNPGGTFGKDLNRNFGHLWGLDASHNPPDDDYCGPYAFSENETQAVDRLVRAHPPRITLSYHSYGQYILYPWGNNINREPVDPRLSQIAWNMSFAMPEGRRYLPMYAREMYSATGDTDDWLYMNFSVLPFTIELATSNRPLDSQVPGICADNLGPALYVLDYTAGAPPPPPPKRSISLNGPERFDCIPGQELWFNFTLENTGELPEDVFLGLESLPTGWTGQLAPGRVEVGAGGAATIAVYCAVPQRLPAGHTASFFIRADAGAGANASARLDGLVGVGRGIAVEMLHPGTLRPGQEASLSVSVLNSGNAFDNISVKAAADAGWPLTQIPSPFELAPWSATNTFIRLRVPAYLPPGIHRFNISFQFWNADGTFRGNRTFWLSAESRPGLEMALEPPIIEFYEYMRENVSIRLVNNGNVRETGNLTLLGDTRQASLDIDKIDLEPGKRTTVHLSLRGKPGAHRLNLSFGSELGYPERRLEINYTIRARPVDEGPHLAMVMAAAVLAVVMIIVLAAFLSYRVAKKRRRARKGSA